jgi:hypothetical protein
MSAAGVDRGWQLSSPCSSALQLPFPCALHLFPPPQLGETPIETSLLLVCVLANPLPLSITDLGQLNVFNVRLFEDLARGADSFLQRQSGVGGGGGYNLAIECCKFLKVPSHQIRLCLKGYGWIGLDEYKD